MSTWKYTCSGCNIEIPWGGPTYCSTCRLERAIERNSTGPGLVERSQSSYKTRSNLDGLVELGSLLGVIYGQDVKTKMRELEIRERELAIREAQLGKKYSAPTSSSRTSSFNYSPTVSRSSVSSLPAASPLDTKAQIVDATEPKSYDTDYTRFKKPTIRNNSSIWEDNDVFIILFTIACIIILVIIKSL